MDHQSTSDDRLKVTYKGQLYDVTKFADNHPGGRNLLEAVKGQEIESYFHGITAASDDSRIHEHSKSAMTILKKYAVKDNASSELKGVDKDGIDWDKPIFMQAGNLGARYWSWIHEPVEENLRLFQYDWMEALTRNQWYVIPSIWLPLALAVNTYNYFYLMPEYFDEPGARLLVMTILFLFGLVTWTLMEYGLHRYLFHWHPAPTSYWQLTIHFALHGIHHKSPMDPDRLVFPPALCVAFVAFFLTVYKLFLPFPLALAWGIGKLCGYVMYDCCHYYLHHGQPKKGSFYDDLKAYHHAHHYKDPDMGYGISSKVWDYAFDTVLMSYKKEE